MSGDFPHFDVAEVMGVWESIKAVFAGGASTPRRGRPDSYQLGEAEQVLCNCCEGELVLCAIWAAQPKAAARRDRTWPARISIISLARST
jgi:hypothetical protein